MFGRLISTKEKIHANDYEVFENKNDLRMEKYSYRELEKKAPKFD